MSSRHLFGPAIMGIISALLLLGGCGPDLKEGRQVAGQECLNDSHCAGSLICSERRCRPVAPSKQQTDTTDAGRDADDISDHQVLTPGSKDAHGED